MRKHAYLIIAHHQFGLLEKTLRLLDGDCNDFFIHIDANAENVPFDEISGVVKRSKVTFVERFSSLWGSYGLVQCELALLEAAVNADTYGYYHLISGADMPIATRDEIYEAFESHPQKEYVLFGSYDPPADIVRRAAHYHPLADKPFFVRNRNKLIARIPRVLIDRVQTLFGVDRLKKPGIKIYNAAQWFSITDGFARYIVENRELIERTFRCTLCPDELFVPTMMARSPFMKNNEQTDVSVVSQHDIRRVIDWKRGHPYVFRSEDFDMLMSSGDFFARKFDERVDSAIIDRIFETLMSKQTREEQT